MAVLSVAEAAPQALSLGSPTQWKAQYAEVTSLGNSILITVRTNYEIGRITSPPVVAQAGQLFTLAAEATTRFASAQISFYYFYLEVECLEGERVVQTFTSPKLLGEQKEPRLLALTAIVPTNTTALRAVLCVQNKFWSIVDNQAAVQNLRLLRLEGNRGRDLRVETVQGLEKAPGERTARLAFSGNWPDATAIALSTTRGMISPSVLLTNGQGEVLLRYHPSDVGAANITANIADSKASIRLVDPMAATLSIGSILADGRETPALIQLTRNGVMLPGRYQSTVPGIFAGAPWSIDLAPGKWELRISRGPQFDSLVQTFEATSSQMIELKRLALTRRVDLVRSGWYGGDADGDVYHGERIYTDVSAETAAFMAQAMGLDWLGAGEWGTPTPATWGEAGRFMESISHPGFLFLWTDERPKSPDGHACLVGLRRPDADPFGWDWIGKSQSRLHNFQYLQLIRASGAATFANHPTRWWLSAGEFVSNMYSTLPFDLCAAGLLDGFNINERPQDLAAWSLLLDHGYRVAATAGADFCLDRPVGPPPGLARLYCYCPKGLSAEALADAMRKSHTIVSTGPILLADINGQPPGSTVLPGKVYPIRVRAWARDDKPDALKHLELWAHGRTIASNSVAVNSQSAEVTFEWKPAVPWDWVAVRAVSRGGWAMTSAFYAADANWQPPQLVPCELTLNITGLPEAQLAGTIVEVWDSVPSIVTSRRLNSLPYSKHKTLSVPVTATVVILAPDGRRKEISVYDTIGMPEWTRKIASGAQRERPLLDWATYADCLERCRRATANVAF